MNPKKIGKFIKKIRDDNDLTQAELANKLGVTSQAVSKWENGKNIPDEYVLRRLSKEYKISVDDILNGEKSEKPKTSNKSIVLIGGLLIAIVIIIIIINSGNSSFQFKTMSSTCSDFKISGSLAYDREKSLAYLSSINYCGGNDNTRYKIINCTLYEIIDGVVTEIDTCSPSTKTMLLEEYLEDVELVIDNYQQKCRMYSDESLFLDVSATTQDDIVKNYKIPLSINENCKNKK